MKAGFSRQRERNVLHRRALRRAIILATCLLSCAVITTPRSARAESKELVGWVERVRLYPGNILLQAKLDTGADSSSLHADDVEEFEKSGKTWVRFTVETRYGQKVKVERPVTGHTRIKRQAGKPERRTVVRLGVCLATTYMETEVSLVDRSDFDYSLLIGRDFLAGNVTVDPASTHTTDPECKDAPKS